MIMYFNRLVFPQVLATYTTIGAVILGEYFNAYAAYTKLRAGKVLFTVMRILTNHKKEILCNSFVLHFALQIVKCALLPFCSK